MPLPTYYARSHKQGAPSLVRVAQRDTVLAVAFEKTEMSKVKSKLHSKKRPPSKIVSLNGSSETSGAQTDAETASPQSLPPNYLIDPVALREWNAIAPIIARRGLLDEGIKPLLAGYCLALARTIEAEKVIQREGRYYVTCTNKGPSMRRRHPAVLDAEEGWASVRKFATLIGIPNASGRIQRAKAPRNDIFK